MPNQISAVMIVKNGASTLERALDSLASFSDVVVLDNGSTDESLDIAARYANVQLHQGEFQGFGPTKNAAAGLAKNDWVLILDSDEAVEPALADAMHAAPLDEQTIYLLNFKAFYKDYQVQHCGWNNQKIRRLYHRQHTQFTSNHVHENLIDTGMRLKELPGGSIQHYSYQSLSDFIVKVDRYSTLFAQSNAGEKTASPAKALFNGAYSFFRTYVIKRGFLDGYVGLVIAFSHMATNFYKYMKLYEANRALKETAKQSVKQPVKQPSKQGRTDA
jgi:glycosyltransferase involved in cell wall biosynthesis